MKHSSRKCPLKCQGVCGVALEPRVAGKRTHAYANPCKRPPSRCRGHPFFGGIALGVLGPMWRVHIRGPPLHLWAWVLVFEVCLGSYCAVAVDAYGGIAGMWGDAIPSRADFPSKSGSFELRTGLPLCMECFIPLSHMPLFIQVLT